MGKRALVEQRLKNPSYEIFMGLLSILSIFNMILLIILDDPTLGAVLALVNIVLVIFFAMDFLIRFIAASSKSHYFFREYGWADMLSSLPFSQTNILRLFRLIKVYRLIKDYGVRNIGRAIVKDRADSALFTLLFVAILVLEFGSLGMLKLEVDAQGSNITDASDALWYMIVTMSTVGYGDEYPVTTAGRVLGGLVILIGVGIFGTLTGYLANFFLAPARTNEPAREQETDVQAKLRALKDLQAQQQRAIDELESLLGEDRD